MKRLPAAMILCLVALFLNAAPAAAADTSPPTQPGTVSGTSVSATGATLTWGKSSDNVDVIGYRVYRGLATASDSTLSLIATVDGFRNTYTATNLRSGTGYKFGVVAIDAGNNASAMRTTTVTTSARSDTTAPAAPSSSSVSVTAFSSSRIDVVWSQSSSSDVAAYDVLRNGVVVGTVERPAPYRYSDNGLAPSTSYQYAVRAVDSAGNASAATSAKSRTTLASGAVKIARGPYLCRVTATSAVISWWTNIAMSGVVSITGGSSVTDPAGSVRHHAVTVSGLAAGTTYSYTVSSGSVSASGSLHTADPAGGTFSFAAISDFGGQSTQEQQNANNIAAAGTRFIQTVGDNVYPSSGFPDPDFAATYSDLDARIFKQFGTVFKSQAFFPANGNKEYFGNGQFWDAFPMPGANHSWYSYDWGDAHVLVLDSEQPFAPGTEQYAFADNDLSASQQAPWRIVVVHGPPYSSATVNSSSTDVKAYLVPLFESAGVDLVLSGDTHNYERSYPLLNGQRVSTGGVTYVITGGGGNGLNSFTAPQPTWSAFRSATYEFTKITVSSTSLLVQAIAASSNTVLDSVTLGDLGGGSDTTAPTAPTNLTVGNTTSSSASLSWTASTDDTGVTGYRVFRGGTQVGTVTGTSFTDTGVSPSTGYSYTVKAVDAAGNVSAASNSVTATTMPAAGGGTAVTLTPAADRTIDTVATSPSSTRLKVDASSPVNDLLMKFTVPSTCTSITAASLRMTVGNGSTDPSSRGGDFYAAVDSNWDESTVIWTTAPAKDTSIPPASIPGPVVADTAYTVDVTRLVPAAGGTFTLRGSSTSGDGAGYYSKEGSSTSGPRLTLTCE